MCAREELREELDVSPGRRPRIHDRDALARALEEEQLHLGEHKLPLAPVDHLEQGKGQLTPHTSSRDAGGVACREKGAVGPNAGLIPHRLDLPCPAPVGLTRAVVSQCATERLVGPALVAHARIEQDLVDVRVAGRLVPTHRAAVPIARALVAAACRLEAGVGRVPRAVSSSKGSSTRLRAPSAQCC